MSPLLVLLHGFTGAPASWDAVRGELGPGVEVLALSLLGHGAPRPWAATFEAEVDRIAASVRGAGAARVHLAGYSLGARVGLGLLDRHPDLFASATLIAPNPGLEDETARRARAEEDAGRAARLRREGLEAFLSEWEALPLFATQGGLPESARRRQRDLRRSHDPEGLARSLEVLGLGTMPDYGSVGRRFRGSLTLLVGSEDAKFLALGRRFVGATPGARLDVVPGAGHNLPLEAPGAVAAQLLRDLSPGGAS